MNDSMSHRGPDASSIAINGPLILGHRRLSIIDLSKSANQPMSDNAGNLIAFNGEIYNFRELRRELADENNLFRTQSDTEVILAAYRRWGLECLTRLNGMFAFAIWDSKLQRLMLARDRMGEKPLFYAEDGFGGFIFASDLNALRAHPSIVSRIDPKAMGQFLALNYTLTDSCLLEGVQKLPPASFAVIERGRKPQVKRYWDLAQFFHLKRNGNIANATEELGALIQDAVRMRMIADVPLGAFLSGGVDSSTISAAMARIVGPDLVQTFSIGFLEKGFSELDDARATASFLGTDHNDQIVDSGMAESLTQILSFFDEPMADTSIIPLYYLAQFSRDKVTVSLSGDGCDEILAGYETYSADKARNLTRWLPRSLTHGAAFMVEKLWPNTYGKVPIEYKLKKFLQGHHLDSDRAHYFWRTIFQEGELFNLLHPEKRKSVLQIDPFNSFAGFAAEVADCHYLDRAMYVDIKTWLPDDILVKLDRASMAHSLECRAPFMDHRLVEFCASLPVQWKMNGFRKKHLLKESQKLHLPREVLFRKKKGFNAPIGHWLKGLPGESLRSITTTGQMEEWFNPIAVKKLWDDHLSNRADNGYKLFGLVCLGVWMSKVIPKN